MESRRGWHSREDGKKLTLHYVEVSPNREKRNDIAAMIQQQLKQIGIDVKVEITKDYRTVVFENGDYDLYGNSQVNSDPEALRSFYDSSSTSVAGKQSLSGLKDPAVDRLLDEGNVETDTAKRIENFRTGSAGNHGPRGDHPHLCVSVHRGGIAQRIRSVLRLSGLSDFQ